MILAPTFAEYEQALKSVGCQITYFYLTEQEEFRVTEKILSEITPALDMVFLCNPNNPTGELTDREMLLKLSQKCREHQVFLQWTSVSWILSRKDRTMNWQAA